MVHSSLVVAGLTREQTPVRRAASGKSDSLCVREYTTQGPLNGAKQSLDVRANCPLPLILSAVFVCLCVWGRGGKERVRALSDIFHREVGRQSHNSGGITWSFPAFTSRGTVGSDRSDPTVKGVAVDNLRV